MMNHNFILTKDGLLGFGQNEMGQLGLGHNHDENTPMNISFFNQHEVISISCGLYHSIILTNEGLFSFGNNNHKQLGLEHNNYENTPMKISFFNRHEVISISCGYYYSIILTNEGLFSFGSNFHGQLGLGHTDIENIPKKISFFNQHEVISIECGGYHSIILTNEGLFSFGFNADGQLGLGHNNNEYTPKKISFFEQHEVISISCGYNHSIILTNEGVFSFGYNVFGQLGLGHNNENAPMKISFFNQHEVIFISCGGYHSIILTNEGLFSFGNNNDGQLGLGHNNDENSPKKISINPFEIIVQGKQYLKWDLQRIIWMGKIMFE